MSKKGKTGKTADKSKKPLAVEEPEPWINELKTLIINDEHWSCNVSMIVETNSYNTEYITVFNSVFVSNQNTRPFIKIISDTSLAIAVLELTYNENISTASNGYKKLCQEAIKYCSSEGFSPDTPLPILASVIKYYIYYLKLKNLDESRIIEEYLQKKQKLKEESLLVVQTITNSAKVTQQSKSGTKSKTTTTSSKKPGSKKTGKDQVQAKFTEIRKRGEEILDTLLLPTDRPDNGPQLYIILNSFKQPELLLELLKLKVPLVALIKLHDFCFPNDCKTISEDINIKICDGFHLICKETMVKRRRFSNQLHGQALNRSLLDLFWERLYKILNNNDNVLLFKDTIFFKFYPKLYYQLPMNKKYSNGVYEMIRKSFYNQLCHLMYDIQDVQRQHENFISHLLDHNTEEKAIYDFNKMDLYTSAIESVPPELINIPLILDCVLGQVEYLVKRKPSTESESKSQNENVVKPNDSHLLGKLKELDVKHDLFNKEETNQEEPKALPYVLIHGDEVEIKTHWWDKNYNVKNITCYLLNCFWEKVLGRHLPVYYELSLTDLQNNTDLFYMLKDIGVLTVRDKLCNLPCLFDDTSLIVEDKPLVYCLNKNDNDCDVFKTNNVSFDQLRCNDVKHENLTHYEDRLEGHYVGQKYDVHSFCFEEMSSDVMLQSLFDSLENFNCVDILQDYFKSKLFIKFHHRKTCRKEQHLIGTLKTRMSLRDFYDYSIDEEFYWLNEEEILYDKIIAKKEFSKLKTALGRLKYLEKRRAYIIKSICSETRLKMYNLSLGENAQPASLPVVTSLIEEGEPEEEFDMLKKEEYIESFNIDLPNRVQFSEKRQDFIISKNSQLHVKKLSRLYKYEAVSLQIVVHGHALYFYQPIDSKITTDFHLIHHSGIVFYFQKNKLGSVGTLREDKLENLAKVTAIAATTFETVEYPEANDIFLKPLFYQLSFSLPSSLFFEFINPNNVSLYIKQYYLNKTSLSAELQKEAFRCYLTDGKVIKFLDDDSVIIYHPNSEIFKCEISQQAVPKKTQEPSETDQKTIGKKEKNKSAGKGQVILPEPKVEKNFDVSIKSYDHTSATGKRISVNDGIVTELENLFSISATDIFNGVIVTERSDGTVLTFNKDATLFVDFPDGTRITTMAYFSPDEVNFDTGETIDEINENNLEELSNTGTAQMKQELDETDETYFEEENLDYSLHRKSEGFLLVNIQHLFEHLNFTSVSVDLNKEELNIKLPCNVDVSVSSEGLYEINFDKHAKFITGYENIIFQEINNNLPEFVLHLANKTKTNIDKQHENNITVETIQESTANGIKQDIADGNEKETNTKKGKKGEDVAGGKDKETNTKKGKKGEQEIIDKKDNITNDKKQSNTITNNKGDIKSVSENTTTNELPESQFFPLLSCKDDYGNILTVNNNGDIEITTCNGFDNICKCNEINMCRQFIFNTEYNGLEVLPPDFLETFDNDMKKVENCVVQNYGSVDHQVLLVLQPLIQNENEKWLMPPKEIKYYPLYILPSTYNDETTFFNPFPKKRYKKPLPKVIPNVLLVRSVNRVNCNIHLLEEPFLENRRIANLIRLDKNSELVLQLFQRGNIPFCKADKELVDYVKEVIIKSMIARVRKRVIQRLEMRLTREYTNILINRLLLPYFDSAQGAVHAILLDTLLTVIQLNINDGINLEKLLCKALKNLSQENLDYLHDRIAPLTISRFCNCSENQDLCQLRILLLAGKSLDGIFPNMMSVFHAYGRNLKKKKEGERKIIEIKEILLKPSETLTEDDLEILHNFLRNVENIPFCSCSVNIERCKLKAILLSTAVLSYIFPNVDSVLKSYKINVNF